MTKKHFISLADMIRDHNRYEERTGGDDAFGQEQIERLADWCQSQNSDFKRARWLGYIAGECGPCGGLIKK